MGTLSNCTLPWIDLVETDKESNAISVVILICLRLPLLFDTFPEGFQWGAATSAHQVSMTVWGTDAIDEGCTLCTFTRSKGPTMWMESR